MHTCPKLRNSNGFTLVEIIIASGILMVLSLLIANVLTNSSKQQVKIEKRARDAESVQSDALLLRLHPVPTP